MAIPGPSSGGRRSMASKSYGNAGKVTLNIRCAVILFIAVYVAGISTGAFFVSVSMISHPSDSNLLSNRQQTSCLDSPTQDQVQTPPILPLKPEQLKLPTPIIVMGLMKAGTTSIYGYFDCGLDPEFSKLSHYDCRPGQNPDYVNMACGHRLRRNINNLGKPPFDSMDHFHLYAELHSQEKNGGMTLPQWDFLDEIYTQFPSATWILNMRQPDKWVSSIDRRKDLRQRFVDNPFDPVLPRGVGADDVDLKEFYLVQAQRIRDFVAEHPSLHLVEVPIDSPNTGQIMEDSFGISKQCWGNRLKKTTMQVPPAMELRPAVSNKLSSTQQAKTSSVNSPVEANVQPSAPKESPLAKKPKQLQPAVAATAQQQRTVITQLKPEELKLPTPILVMGLMKAGTTSIYSYFKCGLDPEFSKLSHYDCRPGPKPEYINMACGRRIRMNLDAFGRPAFYLMDQFHVYAELDAQEPKGGMTIPQWSHLDGMYKQFPSATWILNLRQPDEWIKSIDGWKDLRQRFVDNPFPPVLPRRKGAEDADLKAFYLAQAQRVRDFVAEHPTLTLVEVSIDSPDAGQVLEDAFGVSKQCWGNRNANDGSSLWKEH